MYGKIPNKKMPSIRSGVATKALLFVVNGRRFDHAFDDRCLATDVMRHPVMSDRKPHADPDAVSRRKPRLFTLGRNDLRYMRHIVPLSK